MNKYCIAEFTDNCKKETILVRYDKRYNGPMVFNDMMFDNPLIGVSFLSFKGDDIIEFNEDKIRLKSLHDESFVPFETSSDFNDYFFESKDDDTAKLLFELGEYK